jgi:hypothetical protein
MVADIAVEAGVTERAVWYRLKRARDWRDAHDYASILLLMNGVARGRCRHGVKMWAGGTALCLDCMQTNKPNHPAFRKGRTEERKPPPKSKLETESPGKIVYELPASAKSAPALESSTKRKR